MIRFGVLLRQNSGNGFGARMSLEVNEDEEKIRWMSFMVSPSWHTNWLEEISNIELNHRSATKPSTKSPFSLHLSSSNKHCQDLSNAAGGEMISNSMGPCSDSCSVCLETKWNLAADGCGHEFCTKCALYLSTTNIPQVVPKNNSNKQSMETPSEAFVAYEVEEDRVGVPLLSGLYEVPSFFPVF
ncbi:hypothetical protein Bca52824_066288 [Brassica carinata]|uniref:Zinc finger C3HC4 RING-type domain-containing protein n=2 Tax=Brassica TaxID=3705 RepID=A0A8X7QKT0_BRACI|nr:hypothetical protein Bca52824_066288 [Brassica carinata]